jgi:DNA polymerase III subunit gamma/tau
MSYQVLARKWRPATFEQLVGQSHVLQALTNALSQQRLHHAYLFTGTRGVGKTSLARLFAKGLNCDTGITATPCGQCASCVEIAQGRFVDLIEVDAASRTKVDDTREILDNVQYRPTRGRFKVYLIDEVHMLSRSSFNALLKTLEEPPEHVKFLLATTDPHKLPVTVLSRCLQFNLKSLTQDEIASQLAHVLVQERVPFDEQALTLLAKAAKGSMRDALSLTDQAIAFGAGNVRLPQVQAMLGSIDEQQVLALLAALCRADVPGLMQTTEGVLAYGADPEEVLRSLLELLHQITLTQFAPAAAQLSLYSAQITAFANELSPEQVQLYYQLLLSGRKDLPHAPDPKSGLEMALLRAVAFVPEKTVTRWEVKTPADIRLAEVTSSPTITPPVTAGSHHDGQDEEEQDSIERDAVHEERLERRAALNAEQALILSQAQSQGYVPQAPAPQPVAPLPESGGAVHSGVSAELVPAANVAPESAASGYFVPEYEEDEHEYQGDYQDYQQYMSMGSLAESQSSPGTEPQRGSDSSDTGVAASGKMASESKASEPSACVSESICTETQASAGFKDDLLDAVLASREALLSDLGAIAKEGDAKKSLSESPARLVGPGVKPSPQLSPEATPQSAPVQHNSASQAAKPEPAGPVTVPAATANGASEHTTRGEQDDRPPWEAAPSDALLADLADSAIALPPNSLTGVQSEPEPSRSSEPEPALVAKSPVALSQAVPAAAQPVAKTMTEIGGDPVDLHWYKLMAALDIGGRVRQLAVNSVCLSLGSARELHGQQGQHEPLALILKPDQKHLAADVAIRQLEDALTLALGRQCTVVIDIGVESSRETPLEIRQRFHRELLREAEQALMTDENIQWLKARMAAELDMDSLAYPQERLALRGQAIHFLETATANIA